MTAIDLRNLTKRFDDATAVDDVSLHIEAGELFFLLGPSGCGKTTLLRMLAGFVRPDAGEIFFGTERITELPPRLRDAGMVFQTYALWPHMSVAKNVAYGLQVRGVGREETARRVERALKLVQMVGFENRRPTQLSGGQQQRVALARALVVEPRLLLLDEPLSNLDARLRDEMREEIRRLHRETGLTMVYVTHDQKEAMALANRMAVMNKGRLVQVGSPMELYQEPADRFVAAFLGDANFLPGRVRDRQGGRCTVETALGPLVAECPKAPVAVGEAVVCAVRPQALSPRVEGVPNRITGKVQQAAFYGELVQVRVEAAGGTALTMTTLPHDAAALKPGDAVTLGVAPEQVVVLRDR